MPEAPRLHFLVRAALFSLASNLAVLFVLKYGSLLWPEGLPAHSQNIFWLASGVNLVGLLVLGLRFWPVILLDAFPAWLVAGESLQMTSVGSACNALEALLAAWMIMRLGQSGPLRRVGALVLASLVAPLINTFVIPAFFYAKGLLAPGDYWRAIGNWNLANGAAMLLLAPLLLAIYGGPWNIGRRKVEAALLFLAAAALSGSAFAAVFHGAGMNFAFVVFTVVIYAAARFGASELAIVLGLVLLAIYATLAVYAHAQPPADLAAVIWFVQAFCWVLAATGLFVAAQNEERRRAERLTLEASIQTESARLAALRYQVNPHFLFNALNSIRATLPLSAEVPREMVTALAGYLRSTLQHTDGDSISLRQEIQSVRQYLSIEKKRFGDDLQVTIDVTPEAEYKDVPIFLIQPLVENAIRHGFASSKGAFHLKIAARLDGATLLVDVDNTGEWKPPQEGSGLGLKNVQRRLALLYDNKAAFRQASEDGWVKIHLEMPAQIST